MLMKKISLIFAVLAMPMCMSARSYVAMSDTSYVAPADTAEVNPPVTPPVEEEAVPDGGEAVDTMSYKGFTLNETELFLYVGETFQLEVTWDNPEWAAEHSAGVTYSCGSDVVSVDDRGLVIARRVGDTYVHVQANGVEQVCFVSVYPGEQVDPFKSMTLPLGDFLEGEGDDFEVTLIDGTLRLKGSFWGHACIPSELAYAIIDDYAFFDIYTNTEDSTCTDGWQGSFMVRQTIDVSFEGCTSELYEVYVNNKCYQADNEEVMNAVVYRGAPNRYGTYANVNLNQEYEQQVLEAEIIGDSIHVFGYCYSNCGMDLYCIAEDNEGVISLKFHQIGMIGATCMGNHYVDFTIPCMSEQVDEIFAYGPYKNVKWEVHLITASVDSPTRDDVDAPYYDLQGRKVTHPTRGVYIRNGKKVIL